MRSRMIWEARGLASDHGENPEYDRALVELVNRTLGIGQDDPRWDAVSAMIVGANGIPADRFDQTAMPEDGRWSHTDGQWYERGE